jgi:hypothetical protein
MPGAEGPLHLQFLFVYLDIPDDVFYSKAETRRCQAVPCSRPGVGNLFMLEGLINLAVIK